MNVTMRKTAAGPQGTLMSGKTYDSNRVKAAGFDVDELLKGEDPAATKAEADEEETASISPAENTAKRTGRPKGKRQV